MRYLVITVTLMVLAPTASTQESDVNIRFKKSTQEIQLPAPKIELTLPAQTLGPENSCEAEISLASSQRYMTVSADTEIVNNDCVVSHGEYTVLVRTRGDDGETRTQEFVENWERTEEGRIAFSREYDMDGHLDLIWVRISTNPSTACLCEQRPGTATDAFANQ